jgi:hypothetical protein
MTRIARTFALGAFALAMAAPTLAQQLVQDFELVTFPPTGWVVRNQSTTIGTNTAC